MHTYKVIINQRTKEILFLKTGRVYASAHHYTLRRLLRLTAFFYGRNWKRTYVRGTGITEWERKQNG